MQKTQVVVIGSGPGGYTAAFRAADLGLQVTLIERYAQLGGVCLNVGCIPSKALLHVAKILNEAAESPEMGVEFGAPSIDIVKLRAWVERQTINKLTQGLRGLASKRKITVIQGEAKFTGANSLAIHQDSANNTVLDFEYAIIAVGSRPVSLPFIPNDPRVMDSTAALALRDIPGSMLVLGGGIIGMEMATVYSALGSRVSVVELTSQLMPGVDADLIQPLHKKMQSKLDNIMLDTKVMAIDARDDGLWVSFAGDKAPNTPQRFDKVLSSVGRRPNGDKIDCDKAGVLLDERGFIKVDQQMRTNIAHIFAIGDVAGNPMLAHKAIPEGKVAAEVIAGKKHYFAPRCIPSVAYTDPEIAWVGETEITAKAKQIEYGKGVFPWMASGRSLANNRQEGLTKVLFDKKTNRIIGGGIVGVHAGDLIAEIALAIEMGCDAEDISLTIHPHPTLSETVCQATEVFEGTVTDLYLPK